jgi:hypothetical protein
MKKDNSWPDAETYTIHTTTMALAAAPKTTIAYIENEALDKDMNLYIPQTPEVPFTVPHLYVQFTTTGPHISKFTILLGALIDVGSPSTVISAKLMDNLELCHYPMPSVEDNLSCLSKSSQICKKFVKLVLQSGSGQWSSRTICANMNVGLSIPLILGMPFCWDRDDNNDEGNYRDGS